MGCFSPDQPAPINYATQTRDTLNAQVQLAPALYAANANPSYGEPAYANLGLSTLNTILNGSPGGPQTSTTNQATPAGWYGADGQMVSGDQNYYAQGAATPVGASGHSGSARNSIFPPTTPVVPSGVTWRPAGSTPVTTTSNQPGQLGLLAQMAAANTSQRSNDVADVARLGQSATDAELNANPYNAALLTKLNAQANAGLDAGSTLTPDEQRAMQQQSRAGFAARGMGGSNASLADELLKQFNLGQQLQTQRQGFAESVLGDNKAVIGDPFQAILGRSSGATAQAQGMQPGQQFNPESALSSSITAGNQQMNAMFATSTAQQAGNAIAPLNSAVSSY